MKSKKMKIADTEWIWGERTYVMGILNVTPDSFSDGGTWYDGAKAVAHARSMALEGADIIDVGGESTRPDATEPVSQEEEARRVIPVIERLSREISLPISIDTYKAKTAEQALLAGAHLVNDVWGLKKDPEMASVVASFSAPVCIMHNREKPVYDNLMADILSDLEESIELALKAGVKDEQIILDPGIGFAKDTEQNITVMKNIGMLQRLGYPILLGASRKRFIGYTLGLDVRDRMEGTMAVTAVGIMGGVDIVRVHDVLQNARVAKMTDKIAR
jgi:dihydropteroate synthase